MMAAKGRCEGIRRCVSSSTGDLGESQLAPSKEVSGQGHSPILEVLHRRLTERLLEPS
jgi:hypothetical protein